MNLKNIVLLATLVICFQAQAQIVNVESLRRVNKTSKWSGYTNLNFNLTKNKNKILNLSNKIHIQYYYNKHLVLLINDINFKKVNENTIINRGTQHLRYNCKFTPRMTWEGFVQSQYDEISQIDFRALVGTGPRYKLSKTDKYNYYIGLLTMYEYEKIHNDQQNITHKDIRNSSYFSMSVYPKDNISIVSTTYYQPLYRQLSDFRISSETSIAVKIIKNLALNASFRYLYDAYPAIGVPKEQYRVTQGLTYTFD